MDSSNMNKEYKPECPKCHKLMCLREGEHGKFWGCVNYPKCTYTEDENFVWVTASAVGHVTYCQHQYSFVQQEKGKVLSKKQREQLKRGKVSHRKALDNKRKKSCYIATYALSETHPVVEDLRRWRDDVLLKTIIGVCFVRLYYCLSPVLILFFRRSKRFKLLSIKLVYWMHRRAKDQAR